jgi:hypothetical protein
MVRSAENDGPVGPPVGALGRVKKELVDFKNGLSVGGGDLGSLGQLFFDNLSTLLGAIFAMQNMTNFGVSRDLIDDTIFGKIVPGVGLTLVVGNIYYSWQAVRLTTLHGRQYTAQPYGLNTVGIFAFIFNIIYPVYFTSVDAVGPSEAFLTAYKVAIAANFITGLLSVVFGIIGPTLLRMIPPAALLVPIAGIGFSFLGLEQLTTTLAAPYVAVLANRSLASRSYDEPSHFSQTTFSFDSRLQIGRILGNHVGVSGMVRGRQDWLGQIPHPRSGHRHFGWSRHGMDHGLE